MGVAAHLGIDLADYDARIRTFIPDYETMLDAAAAAVPRGARLIVDLGIGTGALAARCLTRAPRARLVGIDADREMLSIAARRLGRFARPPARAAFVPGNFLRLTLPPRSDAIVASLALHHVRTRAAKARLYARIRSSLARGGRLLSVDCHPSRDRSDARAQRAAWTMHLRQSYSAGEADRFLAAWAKEDVYVPLESEIDMLERVGFRVDVLWRRGSFAVLSASTRKSGS
jgi:SAM-dependent methyltransferase